MIRSIAHDQPQKNFKYLWLDFRQQVVDLVNSPMFMRGRPVGGNIFGPSKFGKFFRDLIDSGLSHNL